MCNKVILNNNKYCTLFFFIISSQQYNATASSLLHSCYDPTSYIGMCTSNLSENHRRSQRSGKRHARRYMANAARKDVQLNATALAELQSLRVENERLRRASLSSSNDSFFAKVEEHRRQRRIDELEEDLEEDPWCKTRRQKLVGVHVISFITGLSCFMYGLYLIVFEAGLRGGNTFVPLVFSVLGGLLFVDGGRRLKRDAETGRCPGQRDVRGDENITKDEDEEVGKGLMAMDTSYDGDDFHSSLVRLGVSKQHSGDGNSSTKTVGRVKSKRQSRLEAEAALKLMHAREEYEDQLDSSASETDDDLDDDTDTERQTQEVRRRKISERDMKGTRTRENGNSKGASNGKKERSKKKNFNMPGPNAKHSKKLAPLPSGALKPIAKVPSHIKSDVESRMIVEKLPLGAIKPKKKSLKSLLLPSNNGSDKKASVSPTNILQPAQKKNSALGNAISTPKPPVGLPQGDTRKQKLPKSKPRPPSGPPPTSKGKGIRIGETANPFDTEGSSSGEDGNPFD